MSSQSDTTETLKNMYLLYLDAQDRQDDAAVEAYLSPSCWQLARQDSNWNLKDRDDIMRVLISMRDMELGSKKRERGKVDMRPLTVEESDTLPDSEKVKARQEGWHGLRVVLEDAEPNGRVVKVNYYFKRDGELWVQCFHDLLWVGLRNGGTDEKVASAFSTEIGK